MLGSVITALKICRSMPLDVRLVKPTSLFDSSSIFKDKHTRWKNLELKNFRGKNVKVSWNIVKKNNHCTALKHALAYHEFVRSIYHNWAHNCSVPAGSARERFWFQLWCSMKAAFIAAFLHAAGVIWAPLSMLWRALCAKCYCIQL